MSLVELYRGPCNDSERLGSFFDHDPRRQRVFIFRRDEATYRSMEATSREECLKAINNGYDVCKVNVDPTAICCRWNGLALDGESYSVVVDLNVTPMLEDQRFLNAWGARIQAKRDVGNLRGADIAAALENEASRDVREIELTRDNIEDDVKNFHYWSDTVLRRAIDYLGLRISNLNDVRIERIGNEPIDPWLGGLAGDRRTLIIDGKEYGFVWIPPGEFDMGSPDSEAGRYDNERLCRVKLTCGYWMLETPTTQKLYETIMGVNPSHFKGDNLPVESASYDDSIVFCRRFSQLGYLPNNLVATLPTEAQWERACRAGTQTAYYWGDAFDVGKLNSIEGGCNGTTPVMKYDPNNWGVFDMLGNVFEWQLNWYEENYPYGILIDPKGPEKGDWRAVRGGSWCYEARSCRCANRARETSNFTSNNVGFRVCLIRRDGVADS